VDGHIALESVLWVKAILLEINCSIQVKPFSNSLSRYQALPLSQLKGANMAIKYTLIRKTGQDNLVVTCDVLPRVGELIFDDGTDEHLTVRNVTHSISFEIDNEYITTEIFVNAR
jgi:hypothetical protein